MSAFLQRDSIQETWKKIEEFPKYQISSLARIYNTTHDHMMQTSYTNHGHVKITLAAPDGSRHTRSVGVLVGQSFVTAPNFMCDYLMILDGDLSNVVAHNLAWRPRWFAWKYTRQLKIEQPRHFHNLSVANLDTDVVYSSIIEAGIAEGLLFSDIWESTYTEKRVFPYKHRYEIVERV